MAMPMLVLMRQLPERKYLPGTLIVCPQVTGVHPSSAAGDTASALGMPASRIVEKRIFTMLLSPCAPVQTGNGVVNLYNALPRVKKSEASVHHRILV